MTRHGRVILSLLVIGTLSAAAAARTALEVEVGWDGAYRIGRWTPVYVTVSDDQPRAVTIELYLPHTQMYAMAVRQTVTIASEPRTFALYAPMGADTDGVGVTVRDAGSGRRLAAWTGAERYNRADAIIPSPAGQLIGISGRGNPASQRLLAGHFDPQYITCRAIDMLRLPAVAAGYESLNLLILNQPDLARMSREQQQAIADWVRAGGRLVCWFSEDALPASSPLFEILPAVPAENVAVELSPGAVRHAGLPGRFARLKGRALSPLPSAEAIELFGGEIRGWRHLAGLGQVVLLPIDPSTFLFENTPERSGDFWRPIVQDGVRLPERSRDRDANNPYYNAWNDPSQQRRSVGASQIMDILGDVPGAGRFGFSYVAVVMVGLMLIVGPIDWFVLKRLGRQPWTWATTAGWIALVTLGAVYMGQAFKSGQLHLHTVRMIEQAGGMTVATTDALGVYSPRTTDYDFTLDPEGWWQPLGTGDSWGRSGIKSDIRFHQDYRGNRPRSVRINVWNLRFFAGQTVAPAKAVIEASLHREMSEPGGRPMLTGAITNRGMLPLTNIILRGSGSIYQINASPLEPGASIEVRQTLEPTGDPFRYDPQRGYEAHRAGVAIALYRCWDISADRSERIESLLASRDDLICLYAEATAPPAPVQLKPVPNVEKHVQLIRALLPLEGAMR